VEDALGQAATDLGILGDTAAVPADVAELSRQAAEVPGVNLSRLLTRLYPDHNAIHHVFVGLTKDARKLARDRVPTLAPLLAAWDPVIAAMLTIRNGDTSVAVHLERHLARNELAQNPAALAAVLRRMISGGLDPRVPAELGFIDAAITRRALGALAGEVFVPPGLWQAMPLSPLLFLIVGAAWESTSAEAAAQAVDGIGRDDPRFVSFKNALRRILAGERDPDLVGSMSDPTFRAVVATVLHHVVGSRPKIR
jgi:hypothetical protein